MKRLWLRTAEKLAFVDPTSHLIKRRRIEIEIAVSDLQPKVKDLRTNSLKAAR